MHDGEFSGWDVVHEEVMSQLNNHGLVGPPFQRDAPPVDPGSWWPGIDYGHCDPGVPVPEKARGSVEQWGLTSADKLPKLQEFGLAGNSYESLVRNALAGNRPLATYLAWILARNCLLYPQLVVLWILHFFRWFCLKALGLFGLIYWFVGFLRWLICIACFFKVCF